MAVDTQNKRSSATGVLLPWMALFPVPDGSDAATAAERAQMAWSYSGIAFSAPAATAAITGTAGDGATEAEIVAGGETIIITLTNDTWVASGAAFNAIRQDIIDGVTSAQSEVLGFNNEVRDKEVVGAVVRTSDTVATVTFSAAAAYDITADETITVTVPASALVTSGDAVVATPTFDVTAEAAATGVDVAKVRARARRLKRRIKRIKPVEHEQIAAERASRRAELQGIFNEVHGIVEDVPEDIEAEVALAAAEVTTVTRVAGKLPVFDFEAVAQDVEALGRIADAVEALAQEVEDEEALIAVLMLA